MLLGNELFFDLMRVGQIKSTSAGTIIQETRLGWMMLALYQNARKIPIGEILRY